MLAPGGTSRVVNGHGNGPLDALVRQLWLPAVKTGAVRIAVNPVDDPCWVTVERYTAIPNISGLRLLVPAGTPSVAAAALSAYRRLRTPGTRVARAAYSALARTGLQTAQSSVAVQISSSRIRDESAPDLPLRHIAKELHRSRLRPLIGVLGANRKVTLQLFDDRGTPAGYAKTSWNVATAELVKTEEAALRAVAHCGGRIRVPAPIASGAWSGRPFVVTTPLPHGVRSLPDPWAVPPPTAVHELMPVYRYGDITETGHARALRKRLQGLPVASGTQGLHNAAQQVWSALDRRRAAVGIATRWHGDFVPWNLAREGPVQLWCWDWESSEEDAPAGLDAIHWYVSVARSATAGPAQHLPGALHSARHHLRAAGTPERSWPDVAALYALALTERVWSYAAGSDGWTPGSITPAQLTELLMTARSTLQSA